MQAHEITAITIAEYDRMAAAYRCGTADHDVSQNIAALLQAIEGEPPHVILDLGCGPGRDLRAFTALGHEAVGLDGSVELVAMARAETDCEVLRAAGGPVHAAVAARQPTCPVDALLQAVRNGVEAGEISELGRVQVGLGEWGENVAPVHPRCAVSWRQRGS